MFIFGESCGLVFGRALTLTRPTMELETEGRRPQVSCCLLHPCTPEDTGACSALKVRDGQCYFTP